MFNICPECGRYSTDKIIDVLGPYAICPNCKYKHLFKMMPLYVIIGACGSGKSKVCIELSKLTNDYVVFESDILWNNKFFNDAPNFMDFRNLCLRVCKNISQAGKPVIICGGGVPNQFQKSVESRYFSNIEYVTLTCDSKLLEQRLKSRPLDRSSNDENFIKTQIEYNEWLKNDFRKIYPRIEIVDTTCERPNVTAEKVLSIINKLNKNTSYLM